MMQRNNDLMNNTRLKALSIALLLFAFTATAAAAEDFHVEIENLKDKVNPSKGDSALFKIHINNKGPDRSFKIDINTGTASGPGWYYLDRPIQRIGENENASTQLHVTPSIGAVAGNVGPEIVVYPLDNSSNVFSKLITYSIRRDNRLALLELEGLEDSYSPNDKVELKVQVKNVIQQDIPANEYQLYLEIDGKSITTPVPGIESGETERISTGIRLENRKAGIYDLRAALRTIDGEVQMERTAKVEVKKQASTERNKKVSKGLLTSKTTFTVKNTGNTAVEDIKIEENIPWYLDPFTTFQNKDLKSENVEGNTVWVVDQLDKGETVEVSYRTNYWPPVILILILVIVSMAIYKHLRKVNISKSGKVAEENYSIHLRVENQTGRVINRAKLEDFVPGIASLVPEFESRKPEKIQKTEEGTKLVWDLGSMDPGEERIITYKLKPKIKVEGNTRLPGAIINYHIDEKKKSKTSYPLSAKFS